MYGDVELHSSASTIRSTQSRSGFEQPLPENLQKKVSAKTQKYARIVFTALFCLLVVGKSMQWNLKADRTVLGK